MDSSSPAELAELWAIYNSAIEAQFEFWLTVTFAVVVAGFVAGKRLSRKRRIVVAILYLLATGVLASRWYYYAADSLIFRDALLEVGVTLSIPWVTIIFRVSLVALGSLAAIAFLLNEKFLDNTDD